MQADFCSDDAAGPPALAMQWNGQARIRAIVKSADATRNMTASLGIELHLRSIVEPVLSEGKSSTGEALPVRRRLSPALVAKVNPKGIRANPAAVGAAAWRGSHSPDGSGGPVLLGVKPGLVDQNNRPAHHPPFSDGPDCSTFASVST